jgi:hypothetical protein
MSHGNGIGVVQSFSLGFHHPAYDFEEYRSGAGFVMPQYPTVIPLLSHTNPTMSVFSVGKAGLRA